MPVVFRGAAIGGVIALVMQACGPTPLGAVVRGALVQPMHARQSVAAQGVWLSPIETPEREVGGNSFPRELPAGGLVGEEHSPSGPMDLAPSPPLERGLLEGSADFTDPPHPWDEAQPDPELAHLGTAAPADVLARHRQHLAASPARVGSHALGDLDAFLDLQEVSDTELALAFELRVQELIDQGLLAQAPLPTTAKEDAEAALDQAGWVAQAVARAQASPPAEEFVPWQLALMQARLANPTAIAHTLLCTIAAPSSVDGRTARAFLDTAAAQSWLAARATQDPPPPLATT